MDNPVVIHQEQLPKITGDQDKLSMVFYNVLDNSLKFNNSPDTRECWISCEDQGDDFLFKIRDNGIGIPDGNFDQVFTMFKRLDGGDTYPGIGAGLTFSRKVVELHNGAIWITSELRKGTTVYFTIPK